MMMSAMTTEAPDERLLLRSVTRAIQVLEAIGQSAHPLSLREIAVAVGIDKSAAQRVTHTLLNLGYIERAPNNAGLVPGKRLLDRSFDYLRSNPLVTKATHTLLSLRETTRERVDFSLFDGPTIIYALRYQSKRETFFATVAGRRIPTYSSAGGRACLSRLSEMEARALVDRSERRQLTPRTLTDLDVIMARVNEARRDGYACALEESLLGEIVIAAAVTDTEGRPVGAVHVAGLLSEWDEASFRRRFSPPLLEAVRALAD